MSNFIEVIQECEAANGAGTKKLIQAALAKADPIAQRFISEALDPFRVFGVRKFDLPKSSPKCMLEQVDYNKFFDTLDKLANRELTGDAAREAVTAAIGLFPMSVWEYVVRVFDKDLKAGFSAETFNKVHPQNKIATFDVMLADKCETPEEFLERLTFPCQGDWKYDGQRTIAFVFPDKPVDYRARSGKQSDHLNGLFDEDLKNLGQAMGMTGAFVVDGEAFAGDFTETINAKKSGNDEAKKNLRLRMFFAMPFADWVAQKCTITMRQGRKMLLDGIQKLEAEGFPATKITVSQGREVVDYADMVAYCNEVIDTHKQEGLILKNWEAEYQWDRTIDWCKVKRFYDVDARITGWYKGRPKSRLENTCGGIEVEGRDEHGRPFRCKVGSGFSDEVRNDIAANFDTKYKHKTAVVTYQEVSKVQTREWFSLRFPTYNYVRDDKYVEALDI